MLKSDSSETLFDVRCSAGLGVLNIASGDWAKKTEGTLVSLKSLCIASNFTTSE